MNWIDIILILVIALAIFVGWQRGFILSTLSLFKWVGTLVIAYLYYPYFAKWIAKLVDLGAWLLPAAFILVAIIAGSLLGLLTRLIIRNLPGDVHQHGINRFLGMVPGAINGYLYAIILSALFLALPIRDGINSEVRDSRLGLKLAMQSEWANRKLAPVFNEAIRQTINSLTIKPGSNEKIDLPFKYSRARARPDYEAAMLEMVNRERVKHGLNPLQPDSEMTQVARAHSQDMFIRGYFAHVSPDGKDPFQRMREANVKFLAAGENLALAQTVEIAHTNLMNSPGHRANILSPSFGRLGIGILDGGFYGLMVSQEFRD